MIARTVKLPISSVRQRAMNEPSGATTAVAVGVHVPSGCWRWTCSVWPACSAGSAPRKRRVWPSISPGRV
jgi:hypothetical protein